MFHPLYSCTEKRSTTNTSSISPIATENTDNKHHISREYTLAKLIPGTISGKSMMFTLMLWCTKKQPYTMPNSDPEVFVSMLACLKASFS